MTAVLIFDAPSVEADSRQMLYDLPDRLNRDDRRALIIRALPLRGTMPDNQAGPNAPRTSQMRIPQERLKPLCAVLTNAEQRSLADWVRQHGAFGASAIDTIQSWDNSSDNLP